MLGILVLFLMLDETVGCKEETLDKDETEEVAVNQEIQGVVLEEAIEYYLSYYTI